MWQDRSDFSAFEIFLLRVVLAGLLFCTSTEATGQDQPPRDEQLRASVKRSLERGCNYLKAQQADDGSWNIAGEQYTIGTTALAVMALINSDVPVNSPEVQAGLNFLRSIGPEGADGPAQIYETSLAVMALCAAEQFDRDLPRIQRLAQLIEESQVVDGPGTGYWGYSLQSGGARGGGDASNGQYAILALRDAAYAGFQVSRETWQRAHDIWSQNQNPDGSFVYSTGGRISGSMTVAGLSTVAITSRMLPDDSDIDAQGRPDCCGIPTPSVTLERGRGWMAEHFSVASDPAPVAGGNHLYYMYGLERAGRMTGVRFFGRYDWYREGADWLVNAQLPDGSWRGAGGAEGHPQLGTSMALLFLSKGLSRVVINKLDYVSPNGESQDGGEWNRHPYDVVNLVEHIDGLPQWPPRLISQTVTLSRLRAETAVDELGQAPILFISGRDAIRLNDQQVSWLRNYVDSGGFIFAVGNCDGKGFDGSFRELITRMFPQGDASLQRLTADHPVYRSEYLLNADGVELWGVDFGCRTSIMYSPEDIGCLWQKWMKHEPPNRNPDLSQRVIRATRIGVNVVAYATGREPPEKLEEAPGRRQNATATIERGLLQIAKLRHNGGWDTAPKALRNLLTSLNQTVGVAASTRPEAIPPTLEEMSRFPIVYMHGRYRFQFPGQQQDALRDYLSRGGVLFADACCGSPNFDRSFRDLIRQMYPDQELKQIPADHEMFTETVGHKIETTRRRRLIPNQDNAVMTMRTEQGPPILEGIEIDGRYAVIYSRYDISCALEHQASLSCDGYVEEDAAKLAVNVVLYAMLQNISWNNLLKPADAPDQHPKSR
ncbi:MAG: DUF4159 domain-containing protein [Planctomycetota bacterium]